MMFIASSLDGGAEKVVADLSNELARQGIDVVVAAFRGSLWLKRLSEKVRIQELTSSEEWYDPRLYLQLRSIVKSEQPDVVHSHGAKASKIILRLSKLTSLRQVATKHNSRKGKVFNGLAHVTAVSGKVADSIRQPATVIYNGVQRDTTLKPVKQGGALSILAVGRLDPIKRFDWLIREVAASGIDCTLDIVGDGPQRGELEGLIKELDLADRVKLLGHQSDVAQRMTQKHLVVIASRSEGFSLVMVEALFYANLFISTEVGAAPELLPDALLVKEGQLADKLQQVAAEYDQMQGSYNAFVSEQASQFEMPSVADRYIEYYRSRLTEQRN
ncbi:glycosyltransferase [Pontibacterium granulatum]|uniref:glycosyltransferase n=1 Tax=Pontibacterium granulatum TaxID=2036029 RepID=UPI00249CC90B|nr:glycosyltransferase [Pontibacterium granulatum]MDI3324624.1 glycosyltransferase [Pontibacterium granulatum]